MTTDAGKQETKVGAIKEVISNIHSLSIDIRDKATELTSAPVPEKEPGKDIEAATDNVSNELLSSLRNIRGILQQAYETLKSFN